MFFYLEKEKKIVFKCAAPLVESLPGTGKVEKRDRRRRIE
jgi:hypothetical protein